MISVHFSALPHLHLQKTTSLKFYELLLKFFWENHDNYRCLCRVTNLLHRFQPKDTCLKNSFLFHVKPARNYPGRQGFFPRWGVRYQEQHLNSCRLSLHAVKNVGVSLLRGYSASHSSETYIATSTRYVTLSELYVFLQLILRVETCGWRVLWIKCQMFTFLGSPSVLWSWDLDPNVAVTFFELVSSSV